MACPSCGSDEAFHAIPEAGLERCPNCQFTRPLKPKPKRKAKKRKRK